VKTGLRERKKAQTRTALASAAMRLALECGVENVTVEAIAEAADVSPRTFRNYFSGKEEAIVAELVDGMGYIADGLRARPAGEPLWESLRHALALSALLPPEQMEELAVKVRMVMASRALLGSQLTIFEQLGQELTVVIAERTGTDARRDLYPRLTAAVAANALRLAVFMWLESNGRLDLAEVTADALALLRAGLPEPGAARPAVRAEPGAQTVLPRDISHE
jgi:AcrR family transcriptional regulator